MFNYSTKPILGCILCTVDKTAMLDEYTSQKSSLITAPWPLGSGPIVKLGTAKFLKLHIFYWKPLDPTRHPLSPTNAHSTHQVGQLVTLVSGSVCHVLCMPSLYPQGHNSVQPRYTTDTSSHGAVLSSYIIINVTIQWHLHSFNAKYFVLVATENITNTSCIQ